MKPAILVDAQSTDEARRVEIQKAIYRDAVITIAAGLCADSECTMKDSIVSDAFEIADRIFQRLATTN